MPSATSQRAYFYGQASVFIPDFFHIGQELFSYLLYMTWFHRLFRCVYVMWQNLSGSQGHGGWKHACMCQFVREVRVAEYVSVS